MGIVIDSNGVINVAASTPGTYRITYTTAGTCPNSSFQDITINALPTITIAGSDFCAGQSTTLTATPSTGTFVWEVNTGSGYNVISGQTNNTISVSTAGDYRAKVTDANGCTSDYSTTLSIAQFASPSVTIATVPGTTICTGDTATLTANATGGTGTITYSWSTGATTQAIDVTTTGTYTVTVTDSNGCTATASQAITASTAATTIASVNNDATMTFNGTDAYVAFPATPNTGDISVSFWVKYSTGSFTYAASGDGIFAYLRFYSTQSKLSFVYANVNYDLTTDIKDGNWHHVVVTYDQSAAIVKGYTDGSLSETHINKSAGTTNNIQTIGAWKTGSTGYFNGEIDEFAVFNTALSSCDIKGIYDATTTVSGQPKSANLLDANTTIPAPVYWNRMGDS